MKGKIAEHGVVTFSLFLIAVCSIPAVSGLNPDTANVSPVQWGPFLTNMTTDSVTINWKTELPCNGTVLYRGMALHVDELFDRTVSEGQSTVIHHVRLGNLTPNQTYTYSVSGSPSEYTFQTFPEHGTIRFVVYGDTREQLPWWNQSTHHALVAGRIAAESDVLFVVHTGDLVNDPADTGEWDRFFAAAGPVLSHIPFYPVVGNHEEDSGILQELFGMPPWYVIQCSDVRVVVLDSNPLPPDLIADQDRFIAEHPGKDGNWTFVALHHPLYSADPNHPGGFLDIRERWEPVFIEWGVSAVFAGHVHAYEHIERYGIHYFTVATGGAPSYPLSQGKPEGYVTGLENTLGYAVVTVNATTGSTVIEFVKVAEIDGSVLNIFPPGTIYERVILDKKHNNKIKPILPQFPLIFTTRFGDRKIDMLN
jgi:hypothetical protein